jgi:hypothetical protein
MPLKSHDAGVTEVISGLPLIERAEADKTEQHARADIAGRGDLQVRPTDEETATAQAASRRRKKMLAIALGATVGVALATGGLVWGLHHKHTDSTPVGVLPVTGQTPADPGGLVSGDKPANPQPGTGPQFAPETNPLPPPPAIAPPAPLPPDPYANDPALNTPPVAPPPPLPPPSAAGVPASGTSQEDDLAEPPLDETGLDDPSYGPTGSPYATHPQYRYDPRRYGSSGYRDRDRSNGPLGSFGDRGNHNGGSRRGPVDDTVPHLGGLGS